MSATLLADAADALSGALAFNDALVRTVRAALPALGDFGFFDVRHGAAVQRTVAAHEAPDIEALLAPTTWAPQDRTDINLCALSSGAPAFHPATDDAWYQSISLGPAHLALLRELAFVSMISVPMRYRGEVVGALTLFMGRSGRRHDRSHLDSARALAALAAPIVVNARLLEDSARAGALLRDSDARLRLAVDAGEMGIWDWDVAHDVVSWSDRVYALHAVKPGEFGGTVQDFARCVHPDDRDAIQAAIEAALAGGHSFQAEFRVIWPDGSIHWLATRATIQRLPDGAPLRMIGITYDVTQRAELLDAERRARDAADAANLAKDGFLAMLGHELRNPLSPITNALYLMRMNGPEVMRTEREIIERQVTQLRRLVDDVMDVSRIASGNIALEREPLDLRELVEAAAEAAATVVAQRRHRLVLDLQPARVRGDPVRLTQVVTNLLVNAVKYTPDGGRIELTLGSSASHATITVRDNGQGIAAELLPHIFDTFVQGKQSLERSGGGLGLGLAIARSLVTLHGGTITARSDGAGTGAEFVVSLPVLVAASAASGASAASRPAVSVGRRVLLVEDNADALESLARSLRALGYDVACAGDGREALDFLERSSADVAVVDIGMPRMNGYELAAALRTRAGASVPVVALTGYGQAKDRQRSLEAGITVHLTKPIDPVALAGVIEEQLRARDAPPA